MDTTRDYYENKIADFRRYGRGRTLYQFCKDEGIDYSWLLRAKRHFGGKRQIKNDAAATTGETAEGSLIRLHFEDEERSPTPESHPRGDAGSNRK